MLEIGSSLREARDRRGLSLAQIDADTHIRARYLQALEDERFNVLPGAAYVRGFLRTYADYLGLDADLFIDEYNARFAPVVEPPPELTPLRPIRRRRPLRGSTILVGNARRGRLAPPRWKAPVGPARGSAEPQGDGERQGRRPPGGHSERRRDCGRDPDGPARLARNHHKVEYKALIAGLELARRHGIDRIRVFSDSALVVNTVNGDWNLQPEHLKDLCVNRLVKEFADIRLSWVPREMNLEADTLASRALGRAADPH